MYVIEKDILVNIQIEQVLYLELAIPLQLHGRAELFLSKRRITLFDFLLIIEH